MEFLKQKKYTIFSLILLPFLTVEVEAGVGNIADYLALRSVTILYGSNALSYQISNIPGWAGRFFTPNGNRANVVCDKVIGKNDLLKWVNSDVAINMSEIYAVVQPAYGLYAFHNNALLKDVKGNIIQPEYNSLFRKSDGTIQLDRQGRPIMKPAGIRCSDYNASINTINPANVPVGVSHGDITATGYIPAGAAYPNPMLRLVPKDLYDININRMMQQGNGQIIFSPNPAQNCNDQSNALSQHPIFTLKLQNNQIIINVQACQAELNAIGTLNLVQLQAYLNNTIKVTKNTSEYIYAELNFAIDATSFEIADVSVAVYRGNSYSPHQFHIRAIDVFQKATLLQQGILSLMQ